MKIADAQFNSGGSRLQQSGQAGLRCQGGFGFTLIEVLITITIFSVLMAAMNGLLFGAMHLQFAAHDAVDRGLPVDRAAAIIKRDIVNMAFHSSNSTNSSDSTSSSNTTQTAASICGGVFGGTYMGEGTNNLTVAGLNPLVNLSFYTTTGVLNDENACSEYQRVDYSLQSSSNRNNGGMDLVRTVTHNPLVLGQGEMPEIQRLLGNVQALTVKFYDSSNILSSSWGDPTSSLTPTNSAPSAVQFLVEFAGSRDRIADPPLNLFLPIPVAVVNTNNTFY